MADQIAELANKDTATFENAETSLSEAFEQYTLVADQEKLSSPWPDRRTIGNEAVSCTGTSGLDRSQN